MTPQLEQIATALNYGDLPETWHVPEEGRFSADKTFYDYQTDALKNAARALYLYYQAADNNEQRKESFARRYQGEASCLQVARYETRTQRNNREENPVFRILSEYIRDRNDAIPHQALINRMSFWMATGSGKTLVMVKLIEYLHALIRHRNIPAHTILLLVPSDFLLEQIKKTTAEFNQSGDLYIELVHLRKMHQGVQRQGRLGDTVTVYYHRSDNISDVQKDALTDYRTYENDGKWYILLDEAHKGGKEDSKRQAYYAALAREGFLFNFSATFTDSQDIITTVKKYNLQEFVSNGHSKNIYLNEREYRAFKARGRDGEINHAERKKIVLKSLVTLAWVVIRVDELRKKAGLGDTLYHNPLMLTLVNRVNTDIENEQNDLWAFFQTLREIAANEVDAAFFDEVKEALIREWDNPELLFGGDGSDILGGDSDALRQMTLAALREAVFLSRSEGALQIIRSKDKKELAFQLKNADAPFALIRIGDTSKWRNQLLAGYEEVASLQEKSFFSKLESSPITILMGSRSFFESWDSNRPNVINFINIGGQDAKKFVVQSVGRGVRIETLPNQRYRLSRLLGTLPDGEEKRKLATLIGLVQPVETLFLFATNRRAVGAVLNGLETEKGEAFEDIGDLFVTAPPPQVDNSVMPLLVPEYRKNESGTLRATFAMDQASCDRFRQWLDTTPDAVFIARDGLAPARIRKLRDAIKQENRIDTHTDKQYAWLPFLQQRLLSCLNHEEQEPKGVRPLSPQQDITHFRNIRVRQQYALDLRRKVAQVKEGGVSDDEIADLAIALRNKKITREEFDRRCAGRNEETYEQLGITKLINHYYLPVILGNDKADWIQHIIRTPSEVEFVQGLNQWVENNAGGLRWDAWMFSKLDESLDDIHIPYYDNVRNEYRRFLPDFIFWMCHKDSRAYRVLFVDPKGTQHRGAYDKLDGYERLFRDDNAARAFRHGKWRVSVELLFFNASGASPERYQEYWIREPAQVFYEQGKGK